MATDRKIYIPLLSGKDMAKSDFDFTERELVMLKTPPSHGDLTFFHPCYGPKRYNTIEEATRIVGRLRIATMTEVVSILSFYSDLRREDYREIEDLMNSRYLWTSTGILPSTSGRGIYIQDRVESKSKQQQAEGLAHMEESQLVKRLEANDPNIRFTSRAYKTGIMTSRELSENELFITLTSKASAKAIAKMVNKSKKDVHFDDNHSKYNNGKIYTLHSSKDYFRIETSTGNSFGYAFLVVDPSYGNKVGDLESKPKQLQEHIAKEKAKQEVVFRNAMENEKFRKEWESFFKK